MYEQNLYGSYRFPPKSCGRKLMMLQESFLIKNANPLKHYRAIVCRSPKFLPVPSGLIYFLTIYIQLDVENCFRCLL